MEQPFDLRNYKKYTMMKLIKQRQLIPALLFALFIGLVACESDDEGSFVQQDLSVDTTELQFPAAGETETVQVTGAINIPWDVVTEVDWLTFTEVDGMGEGSFTVTASANEADTARQAIITMLSNEQSIEINVNQDFSTLSIEPDPSNMSEMTSVELTQEMGVGWNIGNSLEAVGGETAWGNPRVTKELIDAVKAAGFNNVRIPIAWSN